MAVKQKARGKAERRTAPARGTKARGAAKKRTRAAAKPKLKFLKKDRVYHLVDAGAFVKSADKNGYEHMGPARTARTICCDKPIAKVWGVAISRASFVPPVANWCVAVPA